MEHDTRTDEAALESDNDSDEVPGIASTPAYIAAEHRAQIRVANADCGVDRISRLVKLGTLPQSSLDAARDEEESARAALGVIHGTPIGQDPEVDALAALRAEFAAAHGGGASSNDIAQLLDDVTRPCSTPERSNTMQTPINIIANAIRVAAGNCTLGAGPLAEVAAQALTDDVVVDNAAEALRADYTEREYGSPLGGHIITDGEFAEIARIVLRSVGA